MVETIYRIEERELPIIPLRGMWIFPHAVLHFDVGRESSLAAIAEALDEDSLVFLPTQKNPLDEEPTIEEIYSLGTVAKIKQSLKLPNGSTRVLVEGISRGRIKELVENRDFLKARVEEYVYDPDQLEITEELEAIGRLVLDDCREYIAFEKKMSPEMMLAVLEIKDPGKFSDVVASYLDLKGEQNLDLLETLDVYERMLTLHQILQKEIRLLKLEEKIDQEINEEINENQREYYLREQINVIRKELGEDDDGLEDLIEEIKGLELDEDSEKHVLKEARRLLAMNPNSPETNVLRNYLDHILEIPWRQSSEAEIDLERARQILDQGHYGLKDVKERILEFLAVQKLTESLKGPILCFVGPPGVGKTSIAKSIAQATNREFVSMRLGGVRDEAEIRGHRKTYIGAMPGRIITALEKAETMNPVFLLDEIDKLASDFRGDPASALLEVLDPAQNNEFVDSFVEIPVDLSDVFFITTANSTDTIPPALLDRMELIRVSSYTEDEKFRIAMDYLLPKQLRAHGVGEEAFHITRDAIKETIHHFTSEAGVRNLERQMAKIIRKAAVQLVGARKKKVTVTLGNLENFLGNKRINESNLVRENTVGMVNGMAWTQVGGVILVIEANTMKGNGKVQLTGQLGSVMKESAMAAISYIRSHQEALGIERDFYKTEDVHIHVPEGAVPKDGPSAGITMATALVSRLTGKKVRADVAMTGEITLSGRVLAIGGVKEKVLAAHRYDINHIILPADNQRDIEDIPARIRRKLEFKFVNSIDQVLDYVLLNQEE